MMMIPIRLKSACRAELLWSHTESTESTELKSTVDSVDSV